MPFIEQKINDIEFLVSSKIDTPHAFFTRHGGVSNGIYSSLNLCSSKDDDKCNIQENYKRICDIFEVGINDCAVTNQKHTNIVKIISEKDKHICLNDEEYVADGIITNVTKLPLFVFTADCIPLLLCDPVYQVIGAVHCGWRSSVKDIIGNAIRCMKSLGAHEDCICASMGPALQNCCFESDSDVPEQIDEYLGKHYIGTYYKRKDGKYMVDLSLANSIRLLQLGIPEENIDVSDTCTYCSHNDYFSHRYTKGQRGNQASVIMLK